MEEAVADVDEGVLVQVGIAEAVGSHVVVVVVVKWDIVVVRLVLRHGCDCPSFLLVLRTHHRQ